MRYRGELPLIKCLLCARYFTWHVITNHVLSVMFTMTLQGMCYYSRCMGGESRWVAMSDSGSLSLCSTCMYVPDSFVTCHELIQSKPLWFLNNFYWSYLSGEKPRICSFLTMQVLLPIPVAPFKKKQTPLGLKLNYLQLDLACGHFPGCWKKIVAVWFHILMTQITASSVSRRSFNMEAQAQGHTQTQSW